MIIKCKKTKRFLCEVNYEEIIDILNENNISIETPLKLVIPCRNCKQSEVYHVYKDHYVFKENKNLQKNK